MPSTDIRFIASNGTVVNLNDRQNTFLAVGMAGDLMPSFAFIEQQSPAFDGSIVKDVVINPRDITIPVYVQDVSRPAVLNRVRTIIKNLNPRDNDGQLVINSDGKTRVLNCRFKSGFANDGTGNQQFTKWMKTALVFRAGDPYFYDPADTTFEVRYTPRTTSFYPIPPMQLFNPNSFSDGEAETTLDNDGDVQTWPVIRIQSGGTNPTIVNLTTRKKISFNRIFMDGQVAIIDTRPTRKTVVSETGANLWQDLTADSTLFPLVRGENTISLQMTNPSANALVRFIYKLAYLTV